MLESNQKMSALDIAKFSWIQAIKGLSAGKLSTLKPVIVYFIAFAVLVALLVLFTKGVAVPVHIGTHTTWRMPIWANFLSTLSGAALGAYFLPVILLRCNALARHDEAMAVQAWSQAGHCFWRVIGYHILLIVLMIAFSLFMALLMKGGALGIFLSVIGFIVFYLAILPGLMIAIPYLVLDKLSPFQVFRLFIPAAALWANALGAMILTYLLPLMVVVAISISFHTVSLLGTLVIVILSIGTFLIFIPLLMNMNLAMYHNFKLRQQKPN